MLVPSDGEFFLTNNVLRSAMGQDDPPAVPRQKAKFPAPFSGVEPTRFPPRMAQGVRRQIPLRVALVAPGQAQRDEGEPPHTSPFSHGMDAERSHPAGAAGAMREASIPCGRPQKVFMNRLSLSACEWQTHPAFARAFSGCAIMKQREGCARSTQLDVVSPPNCPMFWNYTPVYRSGSYFSRAAFSSGISLAPASME
jgi:hypothetical protein